MPAPKSFLNTSLGKTVVGSGAAVAVGAVAEHVLPHVVNGVGFVAKAAVGGVRRLFSRAPGVAGAPHAAGKPCCGSCARGGPCEGKTATTGGTAKVSFDREALRDGVSTATHAALDSLFPGLSDMLGPAPEAPARQASAPQRGRSKCAGADVGLVLPLPIPFLPDGNDDSKFKEQMEKEKKRVAALNKQLLRDSDARKLDARLTAAKAATDKGLQDVERRVLAQLKSAKDEAKQELETKLRALRTMRLTVPSWGPKQVKAAQEPDWMQQMMMKIVDRQLNPPAPAPAQQAPIMVNPWGFAPFGPGFPSPGFPAQQQQAPMYAQQQAPQQAYVVDDGPDLAQIADEFAFQTLATDGTGGDAVLEFLAGDGDDDAEGFEDDDEAGGDGDDDAEGFEDDDEAGGDGDDEAEGFEDDDEAGGDGDDEAEGFEDDDEAGGDADLEFLSGFDEDLVDDDDDDDESGGCGCAVR